MKKPKFMQGRYGFDKLFFAVTGLCTIIALLGATLLWRIPHVDASGVIGIAGLIMIINLSRVFSKQIGKRQAENIRFTVWLNKTFRSKRSVKRLAKKLGETSPRKGVPDKGKTARCSCGKRLDVPSGSGRQIILCPKCGGRNLVDL